MHIQECLHPKRIFNKYTKEWQYVPCGNCPQCLKSRAQRWIERLNVERKCWKYCLFFTLTYSDDYVPYLTKLDDYVLADLTHLHQAKDKLSPSIFLPDIYNKLDEVERGKLQSFISSRDKFSYLSVYDVQCFVKRCRKNLETLLKNSFKDYEEKDKKIRYYIIGEYGPTTYRAHYHGLFFFSSEKQKTVIEEVISKSWKFGIIDSSYVCESNAAYLAKYLNCTSGLPKIYESEDIRQFSVYSKEPPIGTLYFNDDKVQEIFDTSSCTMLVDYYKGLSSSAVPLWKTFENRLFPKLSCFDRLTHYDRVKLYRAGLYFEEQYKVNFSAVDIARFFIGHHLPSDDGTPFVGRGYLQLYDDYISTLTENCDDVFNAVLRWVSISRRVITQAAAFDVSIETYVEHIERYYQNKDYSQLKSYFKFQEDYSEQYGCRSLVGLDRLYLEGILDCELCDLSAEEIMTLESYGIDVKLFTASDLSVRLEYQNTILPENQRDFWNVCKDSAIWLKKHLKTKVKNDYLRSHPELQNVYNKFNV